MKIRFILAVAALTVLAACSKHELGGPSQEVTFQVASHSAMTRANTDYKDAYSGVPFGAYSWFKGDNPADNNTFMVNIGSSSFLDLYTATVS